MKLLLAIVNQQSTKVEIVINQVGLAISLIQLQVTVQLVGHAPQEHISRRVSRD